MAITNRAPKGGAVGANGEFYEGGKFINTVAANAKKLGSKPSGSGRQEIEPYRWEVAPDGKRSLFRAIAGVYGRVIQEGKTLRAILRQDDAFETTCRYYGVTAERAAELVDMFNRGERWV